MLEPLYLGYILWMTITALCVHFAYKRAFVNGVNHGIEYAMSDLIDADILAIDAKGRTVVSEKYLANIATAKSENETISTL